MQISSCPRNQDIYLKIERHPELIVVKARHDKAFGASSIGFTSRYQEPRPLPLGFTTEDHVVIMKGSAANNKTRDMPAARAGLRKGDVILKITDPGQPGGPVAKEIKDADDFVNAIRGSGGRTLTLVVRRDDKLMPVEMAPRQPEGLDAYQIGAEVGLQRRVAEIEPQSPAYAAGLREGDFVLGFSQTIPTPSCGNRDSSSGKRLGTRSRRSTLSCRCPPKAGSSSCNHTTPWNCFRRRAWARPQAWPGMIQCAIRAWYS